MSFLGLERLHCFITGAAGGIGEQAVTEFLSEIALTISRDTTRYLDTLQIKDAK